jgi:hypothetical protein
MLTDDQKKLARLAIAFLLVNIRDNVEVTLGQVQEVVKLSGDPWPFVICNEENLQELLKVLA